MHPEALKIFSDELQKCAKEVVTSVAQLHPHLEKGDILLLSPEKPKSPNKLKELVHAIFRRGSEALQGSHTHSAMYVGDNRIVETRLGRGVEAVDLKDALDGKSAILLRPTVAEAKKEKAVKYLLDAANQKSPYSLSSLIDAAQHHFTGLKLFKRDKNKHICSNLITAAYGNAKLVTHKHPDYVLPADFLKSPKLKPVATLVPGAK